MKQYVSKQKKLKLCVSIIDILFHLNFAYLLKIAFLHKNVLQGSLATHLCYGRIFSNHLISKDDIAPELYRLCY